MQVSFHWLIGRVVWCGCYCSGALGCVDECIGGLGGDGGGAGGGVYGESGGDDGKGEVVMMGTVVMTVLGMIGRRR